MLKKKTKILFVVGKMNRWGTETYVKNVINQIINNDYEIHILVKNLEDAGVFFADLASRGVVFHHLKLLPSRKNFFSLHVRIL